MARVDAKDALSAKDRLCCPASSTRISLGSSGHLSISIPVVKVLWSRALNQCAFPTCRQLLTEDSVDAATGETLTNAVGEQAHIRSYKTNGPRYDPDYPKSKLHTYENLILLCPTHHEIVTGPRELVHGERESFIGGYRWQRSGLAVGSPAMSAGGGGCSRVSSR